MRRRTFLCCLVGAVAAARPARAQISSAPRKIGYLHPATIDPESLMMSNIRPKWRELGYVEGETILLRTAQGDVARQPWRTRLQLA
jgi:putative tryptophan/tyrosine transport system substrate-binding protein